MAIHNIKCIGGCGKTCGSVETSSTGGKYRGDAYYGFRCPACAAVAEAEAESKRQMIENTKAKFIAGDVLSKEEREQLAEKLFGN